MDQWERVIPHFFLTRDNKVCGQPGHVQASNLNWKLLPCLLTLYFTIFCVMLTESGWLNRELCIGINSPWCSHIKTVILLFNNKTSWYCVYFVVGCPSVCVIRTPWLHNIMPYSTKIMMKKNSPQWVSKLVCERMLVKSSKWGPWFLKWVMNCLNISGYFGKKSLDGDRQRKGQKKGGLSVVTSLGGQEIRGGVEWTQHYEVIRPLVIFTA